MAWRTVSLRGERTAIETAGLQVIFAFFFFHPLGRSRVGVGRRAPCSPSFQLEKKRPTITPNDGGVYGGRWSNEAKLTLRSREILNKAQ
jgi:hypothetical protein